MASGAGGYSSAARPPDFGDSVCPQLVHRWRARAARSSIVLRQPGPRNSETCICPETLASILYIAKVLRWPKGSTWSYSPSGCDHLRIGLLLRSRAVIARQIVSFNKKAGPIRGRVRIHAAAGWAVLSAALPIGMTAVGWRIPVTDHTRVAIQPTTVQPVAKFNKPIHGHR